MIEAPSDQLWGDLRSRRPTQEDALETVEVRLPCAGTIFLYGVDRRGDLHLLLRVEGAPPKEKPPDLKGLKVRHRQLAGYGEYVDVIAAPWHQAMFSSLCKEILDAVTVQKRRPWEAVFSTIRAWQGAWRVISPGMDKVVQVGLMGELLTLEHIMIPALGPAAVNSWSGPDCERHDFVGSALHVEVKTTRRRRHEHEISRVDQLSVPKGKKLIVASLLLEESVGGSESLATKIDSVSDLLRGSPAASDVFQSKLVQLGWAEEMRGTGELLRFHEDFDSLILEVSGQFPRIPPEFQLPPGIISFRYTVDLENLPSLDVREAIAAVTQGF